MASGEPATRPDSPDPRQRLREVGNAALLGAGLAVLAMVVLVVAGESVQFASEKVFALGALVFGFSLLGWSGTVFAGRGMEHLQQHLGGSSDWTEADSRQAMAVLGSVGLGGMVGVMLATTVLGALL